MKTKTWNSSSGKLQLTFTKSEYNSIPITGQAIGPITELIKKPRIIAQFGLVPDQLLIETLKEFGCWDDSELQNRADNIQRILWIACLDLQE